MVVKTGSKWVCKDRTHQQSDNPSWQFKNIIYVAAPGPLWSDGPDRGIYQNHRWGQDLGENLLHQWTHRMCWSDHGSEKPGNFDCYHVGNSGEAICFFVRRSIQWYFKSTDGGKTWRSIRQRIAWRRSWQDGIGAGSFKTGSFGYGVNPKKPNYIYLKTKEKIGKSRHQRLMWRQGLLFFYHWIWSQRR